MQTRLCKLNRFQYYSLTDVVFVVMSTKLRFDISKPYISLRFGNTRKVKLVKEACAVYAEQTSCSLQV